MATITAATLDSRLHLEDAATNTDLENLIDGAIDLLNVYLLKYGKSIGNMTGTAGSKTVTVTSAEKGAIIMVACSLYSRDYKTSGSQSESSSLGPASYSMSAASTSNASELLASELASNLAREEMEVDIG